MSQFTFNKKYKSLIVPKSKMEIFLNKLLKVIEEDNEESVYKRSINLGIDYGDGSGISGEDPVHFCNNLLEKREIGNIYIIYRGLHISFSFSFFGNYSTINLQTEEKSQFLDLRDEVSNLLSDYGWNWFVHSFAFYIFLSVILISLFTYLYLFFRLPKEMIQIGIYSLLFLTWPILSIVEKVYPTLVITDGNLTTGRVLKKDVFKIISIFIGTMLLPYLWNVVASHKW